MRVIVTGATGLIGSRIVNALLDRGDEVTALVRNIDRAYELLPETCHLVRWNAVEEPAPIAALSTSDAVIHLVGEPIERRWTTSAKVEIRRSREIGTRNLVLGLTDASPRPKTLVCASAIGYYGPHGDEKLDESSPPGTDFLAIVCRAWEEESKKANELGVRVATLRTGLTLAPKSGVLGRMLPFFRLGLGGPVSSGKQYLSWIELDDLIRFYLFALDNEQAAGPINATAPNPVTNREFTRTLAQTLNRPAFMPVPKIALKVLFGEIGALAAQGQRVIPEKARELEFHFNHTEVDEAISSVLTKDSSLD